MKKSFLKKNQKTLNELALSRSPNIWDKIKKLNCPPQKSVAEVIKEDGSITRDGREVTDRWYSDISRLFSGLRDNPELAFDQSFYEKIINLKEEFENMTIEDQEAFSSAATDNTLNRNLEYQEVSESIDKAKSGKAFLEIPNEVLKNENAKSLLHKFLNLCFTTGLSSNDWNFSDIRAFSSIGAIGAFGLGPPQNEGLQILHIWSYFTMKC